MNLTLLQAQQQVGTLISSVESTNHSQSQTSPLSNISQVVGHQGWDHPSRVCPQSFVVAATKPPKARGRKWWNVDFFFFSLFMQHWESQCESTQAHAESTFRWGVVTSQVTTLYVCSIPVPYLGTPWAELRRIISTSIMLLKLTLFHHHKKFIKLEK